jgi:thiol:disulfide interchange protein
MRIRSALVVFLAVGWLALFAREQNEADKEPAISTNYVPVHKYVPGRDAAIDIQQAISEAKRTGKRILLEVGGDWCVWCQTLQQFYEHHPDVVMLREKGFVTVYVYYGSENQNAKALAPYPKLEVVPQLFVLDQSGALLHSEGIGKLEVDGGQPDPKKIRDFLMRWSPVPEQPGTS